MNKITLKGYSDEEVYLLYQIEGDYIVVVKTFVDEKYRGQGLAKKLMLKFLEETKTSDKKIAATCSYAQNFLLKIDDERIDKDKIRNTVSSCRI